MSATVIPFERRTAKADQAPAPTSAGPRRRNRSARVLCIGSATFGFAVAAAIEVKAFALAVLLIVAGLFALRRL